MTIGAKEVLFNAGEALSETDLNNLQRYIYSLIADGVLGTSCPGDGFEAGMQDQHLYVLGHSGAPFENGSGALAPNFKGGVVMQRPTTTFPTGNDAQVLMYYLTIDEPSVARPAAVTDPRWDVVSIQLAQANADSQTRDFQDAATRALTTSSFNKQRQVQATITWTQGVEAASPVEPAIPVGHVKLAAFRVVPAATLFDATTDIRDYRMPIGMRRVYRTRNWVFDRSEAGVADYDQDLRSIENIATASSTDLAFIECPLAGGSVRLLAVGLGSDHTFPAAGADLDLVRSDEDVTTGLTNVRDLSSLLSSGSEIYAEFDILASHGEPLWANGYAAGFAVDRGAPAGVGPTHLELRFAPVGNGSSIMHLSGVRWTLVG